MTLAAALVAVAVASAVLAGGFPVECSAVAVLLFAGPHNWLEARYVLGRLPARVGKLRGFFLLSAAGVVGLTAGYALLPWAARSVGEPLAVAALYAAWNTLFVWWVAALVWGRSRTNPRFDGGWVWPAALLVTSAVWVAPAALNVALVYAHPLMALWLLDRELARSRRDWRPAYRASLLCVPVLLGVLAWHLAAEPDLPGDDPLTASLARHAGGDFLAGVSTRFLVAAHAFLELVHYAAWVVLIPLVGLRSWPWELRTVPAARRGRAWARGVALVLVAGLLLVGVLWAGFAADYGTTRTVYFTAAMLHVLAEVPFLLRML